MKHIVLQSLFTESEDQKEHNDRTDRNKRIGKATALTLLSELGSVEKLKFKH
jgi:hypothetical protein